MRAMALSLMLFAGAFIADGDVGRQVDAAEATTMKAKRADKQRAKRQRPEHQKQAYTRGPTLPPNIGIGIGTGL
jgi:hypothetical protein